MIGIGAPPLDRIGLRQRRGANVNVNANEVNAANNNNTNNVHVPIETRQQQQFPQAPLPPQWRTSHVYCFISAILAVLAIITSSTDTTANLTSRSFNGSKFLFENSMSSAPGGSPVSSAKDSTASSSLEASTTVMATPKDTELITTNPVSSSFMIDALDTEWWRSVMNVLFSNPTGHLPSWMLASDSASRVAESTSNKEQQQFEGRQELQQKQNQNQPWWKMAWPGHHHVTKQDLLSSKHQNQQQPSQGSQLSSTWWQNWLDPALVQGPIALTDLIDKVLTSTPRLLAIANLLLALTYQTHTFVADWFLGGGVAPLPGEWTSTGRERLGSFLVFKLLLICAVVTPDTLDWLILLSWYTLLSFLRSLAHLAAATTSHTTQSGQPPRTGVLQLLLLVLLCDFVAAAVCVALFQLAGLPIVILLVCDCALLAVEVLGHILKHSRQILEELHEHTIAEMEEEQMEIHNRRRQLEDQQQRRQRQQQQRQTESSDTNVATDNDGSAVDQPEEVPREGEGWDHLDDLSLDNDAGNTSDDDGDDGIRTQHFNSQFLLFEDSRRLDQSMDELELQHGRRLAILDTTIFILQLVVHTITVLHFLHIWTLHGIQFTLIDGVLALHLHSALSAASRQIAERRNLKRIYQNLNGLFPDASEHDLKMANASGDVCCICLGTMSVGSVKRVGCGHLYHTNCLREVIERAHSIESAKCPLCRASVVDGSPSGTDSNPNELDQVNGRQNNVENENAGINNAGGNIADINNGPAIGRPNDAINHRGERALFRFSTEGILPAWMPLPAFSFEVVRRPPRQDQAANNNQRAARRNSNGNNNNEDASGRRNGTQQRSFLRRLFLLTGALPMTPEEEARALAQLVDMFPQYDRSDLLRELRDRGSIDSVVEAVLLGVFSGQVRGSAGGEARPATANNPARRNSNGGVNNGVRSAVAELQSEGTELPAEDMGVDQQELPLPPQGLANQTVQ